VIARNKQVKNRNVRKYALLFDDQNAPARRSGTDRIPVLAGYRAGIAANASGLIEIECLLHIIAPFLSRRQTF
jgi:hypothetical protein